MATASRMPSSGNSSSMAMSAPAAMAWRNSSRFSTSTSTDTPAADHRIAFGDLPVDPHGGVQLGEDGVDIRHAAQDRGLTGDDRGTAGPRRRNERRREVAAADILLERPFDLGGQILGVGNG